MGITIGTSELKLTLADGPVGLRRDDRGVIHIQARDRLGFAAAQGFAHAIDRGAQLELTRIIGQGRLCECLDDSPANLEIDRFIRWIGFSHEAKIESAEIDAPSNAYLEAYARGIDAGLAQRGRPLPFRMIGHRPTPWQTTDALTLIKLMGYIALAQHQGELEKTLIQALQVGVDPVRLGQLFKPHLSELEPELLNLLRRVKITSTKVPAALRWLAPTLRASNNWAIAPSRSASGHALLASDPHLECNRLPAIWYEYAARIGDSWEIGISVPGAPGMVMGRTQHFAAGFTYGYLDMIDFFVEECQGLQVRRGDAWQAIAVREETILRKKHPPVKLNVYSTDVGLLEIESGQAPPEKGLVLAQALSTSCRGAGDTLNRMRRLGDAKDALEVCEIVRGIAISTNWVVADTQGHIAYQQAGYAPVRRGAGIVALPAWDRQNHWQGLVDFQALKHEYDPPRGVVASANETINPPGGPTVVNAAAPRYRVDRIFEALEGQPKISVAQCKALQNDVISRQALRFLPFVVPFLPENECANLLRTWDGAYDPQSRTPTLFEAIYAEVLLLAFGEQFLGRDVWRHLADETALTHIYFGGLDRTLLDEPRWWSAGEREFTFAQAVSTVMARYGSVQEIPLWGEVHRLNMNNLFLAGKIGQWLKASRGPYPLAGGRATLVQTAVFRADGRETSICPSWRMVTDMGRDEVETVLAGGPSERIFSPLYDIDIEDWIAGRYKIIRP